MSDWSEDEVERTVEEVKRRSITDPEFRALALTDPDAAIMRVNPILFASGCQIKFIDNAGPVKSFVLPDVVNSIEELSDAELETVAGGVEPLRYPRA